MDKEKTHECCCENGNENNGCSCEEDHNHDGCCCEEGHDHDECNCGCHEGESIIVNLEDEDGRIIPCEVVDGFVYDDIEYILVQSPDGESVYLFKVVGEGEDAELEIPDDEEFDKVSAYYESLLEQED